MPNQKLSIKVSSCYNASLNDIIIAMELSSELLMATDPHWQSLMPLAAEAIQSWDEQGPAHQAIERLFWRGFVTEQQRHVLRPGIRGFHRHREVAFRRGEWPARAIPTTHHPPCDGYAN